jgi:hypothetical protein
MLKAKAPARAAPIMKPSLPPPPDLRKNLIRICGKTARNWHKKSRCFQQRLWQNQTRRHKLVTVVSGFAAKRGGFFRNRESDISAALKNKGKPAEQSAGSD